MNLQDVCDLIGRAIMEEPPIQIKDGGIIKEGYNEEIDTSACRKDRR